MAPSVVRLVAAVLLTAATGLGVSAPAQAASCLTGQGVTVVVDFHELGGGAQAGCDADGGGRTAAAQLTHVGHTLAYVQRQPGFVCRVDGTPSSDPCVNTPPSDAYWSLWWSDGRSGTWVYSSAGVGSLTVPDGGYVALSWQGDGGRAAPRVPATAHAGSAPSSSPTRQPSSSPTRSPASTTPTVPSPQRSSSPSASSTATSSGSAGPSLPRQSSPARHHHPSGSPSAAPERGGSDLPATTDAAAAADTSSPASGSSLPGWLAPALVAALFVAAAAVAVVRRKRSGDA